MTYPFPVSSGPRHSSLRRLLPLLHLPPLYPPLYQFWSIFPKRVSRVAPVSLSPSVVENRESTRRARTLRNSLRVWAQREEGRQSPSLSPSAPGHPSTIRTLDCPTGLLPRLTRDLATLVPWRASAQCTTSGDATQLSEERAPRPPSLSLPLRSFPLLCFSSLPNPICDNSTQPCLSVSQYHTSSAIVHLKLRRETAPNKI